MGEVYRARDMKLRREVALKILPSHVSGNPDSLSRFEREAVTLAQLSHPNILSIHDFGTYGGVTVAVTELLEGETLRRHIDESPIPTRRCLEIGAEVAEGLAIAHSKGIIHRDLKPENIFVTNDNQIKILDFGLARMDSTAISESGGEGALPTETQPGLIKGTIGYMAPEQLRGLPVDARSDIFSLGCVLYEMLTGRRAFAKGTVADTMSAILTESPPDFVESGRQVPPEAERVTTRCLEKEPSRRFQSARDLAMHLRSLASVPQMSLRNGLRFGPSLKPWGWMAAILAVVLIAVVGVIRFRSTPAAQEQARPSVAVLYFENNTGEASLDWLRTALTNMLVTDLSQSPQIDVLGTDRLYQILKELDHLDEPTVSFDTVRQLARKAGVTTVVLGSFVKAGNTFRLSTRVQEAETGRILATEKVEGEGDSSLFAMVDELTRRIQSTLEVAGPNGAMEKGIESVTTSSVEALRLYVEGNDLHLRSKEKEAVSVLEKAVALDPEFAMALAKLSVVHWNMGQPDRAYDYAQRALQHADRLPDNEKYYIQGRFYSMNPETMDKAIQAYETSISLFPSHGSSRHNLANLYMELERFDDAITHFEVLRKAGSSFAPTYVNLANAYAATGKVDTGLEVMKEFLEKHPDSAAGHRDLAAYYFFQMGRDADALQELRVAEVLAPGDLQGKIQQFSVLLVSGDLPAAERVSEEMLSLGDPYWRSEGLATRATLALYRGNPELAERLLIEAANLFDRRSVLRARFLLAMAQTELMIGKSKPAIKAAGEAYEAGRGTPFETETLVMSALAHALDGNSEQATANFEEARTKYSSLPPRMIERQDNQILGTIALLSGDYREAIARFEVAWATLPPEVRKEKGGRLFETGLAFWLNGQPEEAVKWFRQLGESRAERLANPIGYVRSLYYLGEYHAQRGDVAKAREALSAYLGFWGQGSIDSGNLARARTLLASLK